MGGVRLGSRVASADSISFTDQANCKKKKKVGVGWRAEGNVGGGAGDFSLLPCQYAPCCGMSRLEIMEWLNGAR